MVDPPGFEPGTGRLKVGRSTVELGILADGATELADLSAGRKRSRTSCHSDAPAALEAGEPYMVDPARKLRMHGSGW